MNIKRLAILITLFLIPLALGTDYYPNTLILQGNTTASASNYTLDVAGDTGTGSISDAETFSIIGDNGVYTAMSGNVLTISKVNQTFTDTDTDSFWPINTTVLYNNSGTLTLVESWLIAIINLYDSDTTYNSDEWYINEVANVFNFNEVQLNETITDKLTTKYFNTTQANAIAGTFEGDLSLLSHNDGLYDDITVNLTEAIGTPALDVRLNFTNISSFNKGIMRYYTSALHGENPLIQLWECGEGWEDYPPISDTTGWAIIEQTIFDDASHICDGVVQMRIYQGGTGNTQDKYYIDWVAISDGVAVPSGQETDPYSVHRDGTETLTADWDAGNWSITAYFFNGFWNGSSTLWGIQNFTSTNISTWDTAYSWGDHSTAGYLTSVADVWLNESGDNATGVINLNAGATTTFINSTNGESYIILNSSGVFICGGC